jgi:hypothetical protein
MPVPGPEGRNTLFLFSVELKNYQIGVASQRFYVVLVVVFYYVNLDIFISVMRIKDTFSMIE